MIRLDPDDVLAHQDVVSWADECQVEQDLLLCRAMAALFDDRFLSSQIAMRGGTLLHKVHLAPAVRYSEDIDLVVVGPRPERHIRAAITRVLADVLGKPKASVWSTIKLAVRNTMRPSRILRMTYVMPSVMDESRKLEIVIEANVTERKPHRAVVEMPFSFPFRGNHVHAQIKGFDIHEMLGTKLRALFQRQRGRDLFDLYWALIKAEPPVEPKEIMASFEHYLGLEGTRARRAEFVRIIDDHLGDEDFCSDMQSLLRADVSYDPQAAGECVKARLLSLLPK